MNISVLIPAYMPDKTLVNIAKELFGRGFSVLIVDDGSGTDFSDIFEEAGKYSKILNHEVNLGKGAALKTGFSRIREIFPESEAVITADADGQHSTADICRVAEELSKGASCVISERQLGKDIPARSKFGNDLSRFVYAASNGRYLYDTQSGLRGFKISHCDWLINVSGEKYDYEMAVLIHLDRMNIPITRLPIETIYINSNSSSHFNPVLDTLRIYKRFAKIMIPSLAAYTLNIVMTSVLLCVLPLKYCFCVIFGAGIFFTVLSVALNKLFFFKKMSASVIFRLIALSVMRMTFSAGLCCLGNLINFPVCASFLISVVLLLPLQFFVPYLLAEAKN